VENREYISMTFQASKSYLPVLKKQLREIRDQLNKDKLTGSETEIFQICIALFPHTDLKA
jgi:hypothetical protein